MVISIYWSENVVTNYCDDAVSSGNINASQLLATVAGADPARKVMGGFQQYFVVKSHTELALALL